MNSSFVNWAAEGVAAPLEPSVEQFIDEFTKDCEGLTEVDKVLMAVIAQKWAAAVSKNLQEELAQSREKNRELNRKCQALQHTINIGAERKAWYGYYQACASLYDGAMRSKERAESRILELEKEITALRETK